MKQILMNAVHMSCVGDIAHGLWTHPRDQSSRYTDLDYWAELARTLERGCFDSLFLADIVGANDVYEGRPDAALRAAVQMPIDDPLLLVPAMAHATRHLGFGVTANLSYEQPYLFARRFTTLDHLSRGRVAWNVVTGFLDSAARAMGQERQLPHDERYARAEDFMDVVYKLWEGSWEDDALPRDKVAGVYALPEKVHAIDHRGPYYRVQGAHLSEPSIQRTPVIFQAGASARGIDFAARHAECVFVSGNKAQAREIVGTIRARAAAFGRDPADLRFFLGVVVVVAPTDALAQELDAEYRRYASPQAGLAHFSSQTGIDFSRYGLDEPISLVKTESVQSFVESVTSKSAGKAWTVRKLLEQMTLGSRHTPLIGSPQRVADALESWVRETDIDGFNLVRTVVPEGFTDFVDLVIPELQSRGSFKTTYAEGSLRHKLFGAGDRLPRRHPAGALRRAASGGAST
ncbi:LLM class flavin-dependent oxidoreductase [Variovorax boronicumulans]|uniref:LLM class flavin-dependent oxidoreductase n=1 Tax=Variovorax boronicumulans TaxID=436515 RepID=UPI001C598E44